MIVLPTINSTEFYNAFTKGDYPAVVKICDEFARDIALDAYTNYTLRDALFNDVRNPRIRQHECTDECFKDD